MTSTSPLVSSLSPESTVTSLLSSSGHLGSHLQPAALSQSFCYKDKDYSSATAALDAYITDFEHSRHGNAVTGAGLVLPCSPRRSTAGGIRNRDVLRERLSESELDFLTLPVSSLHHCDNRDRVSMTTNELLNLPLDGSMPITHTTAFLHGLAMSRVSTKHNTSCRSHAPRGSNPIRMRHCSRCGGVLERTAGGSESSSIRQPDLRWNSSQGAGPASGPCPDWWSSREQAMMHIPHWLSSNKAAVDCSDIHSLPDLPYPPWIGHCFTDQSERGYGRGSQTEQSHMKQGSSQGEEMKDFPASAPSWVLDLGDDRQQLNIELSLKNLRLQFAEHISHLTSGRTDSARSLCKDGKIESLIQKADRVLDSLQTSASASPVPPESADQDKELLLTDLSVSLDRMQVALHATHSQSQPGPLEAFKQMLFRLEAVETELHRWQSRQQGALQGRQAPQQGALQERQAPQQGALQERQAPQQGALQGRQAPQQEALQERQAPQQGALQERQAPQQGALQERQAPQQEALRGRGVLLESTQQRGQQGALHAFLQETEPTKDQPEEDGAGPSLQRALLHLSRLKLLVQNEEDRAPAGGAARHRAMEPMRTPP